MLCARELSSLLVNLFPSNSWDSDNTELIAKELIEDYDTLSIAIGQMECIKSSPRKNFDKKY